MYSFSECRGGHNLQQNVQRYIQQTTRLWTYHISLRAHVRSLHRQIAEEMPVA